MGEDFTNTTTFSAEGARVGIVICKTCGAAILIDPRDDEYRPDQHAEWHRVQEAAYRRCVGRIS